MVGLHMIMYIVGLQYIAYSAKLPHDWTSSRLWGILYNYKQKQNLWALSHFPNIENIGAKIFLLSISLFWGTLKSPFPPPPYTLNSLQQEKQYINFKLIRSLGLCVTTSSTYVESYTNQQRDWLRLITNWRFRARKIVFFFSVCVCVCVCVLGFLFTRSL